jgi:MOSC domain-containing protein YiiM
VETDHVALTALEDGLGDVRASPATAGTVELIVRRPAEDEREVVEQARLDPDDGLVGDTWRERGSKATGDGSPHPDMQLTLMNARSARLVARERERWALAGDQLYVDFDLSVANLPPGTRLKVGSAVVEVTAVPHRGCGKFSRRFGVDAMRFVNSEVGRELNLRGINAKVVSGGTVRAGDPIERLGGDSATGST